MINKTENRKPKVSVITPCYNDGKYLLECVDSVKSSTYSNIEHIIINDGSTHSETLKVLKSLEVDNKLTIINTPNQGVCKARNSAIAKSSGEYILPLDGDDKISPNFIELAVEKLLCNLDAKVVAVNYKRFGADNRAVQLEPYSIEKLMGHNLFTVSSMFRRSDFDRIEGFNENMKCGFEDWDFWLSMLEDGGEVIYLKETHFYYRIKPAYLSRNRAVLDNKNVESHLRSQVWENHRTLYAKYLLNPKVTFEYLQIKRSKEYIVGCKILAPIRTLLRLIK